MNMFLTGLRKGVKLGRQWQSMSWFLAPKGKERAWAAITAKQCLLLWVKPDGRGLVLESKTVRDELDPSRAAWLEAWREGVADSCIQMDGPPPLLDQRTWDKLFRAEVARTAGWGVIGSSSPPVQSHNDVSMVRWMVQTRVELFGQRVSSQMIGRMVRLVQQAREEQLAKRKARAKRSALPRPTTLVERWVRRFPQRWETIQRELVARIKYQYRLGVRSTIHIKPSSLKELLAGTTAVGLTTTEQVSPYRGAWRGWSAKAYDYYVKVAVGWDRYPYWYLDGRVVVALGRPDADGVMKAAWLEANQKRELYMMRGKVQVRDGKLVEVRRRTA